MRARGPQFLFVVPVGRALRKHVNMSVYVEMSVHQPEAPHDAVLQSDETAVRSWLERGGRANTAREYGEVTGVTLLMDAAGQGQERVVELLLQRGADINTQSINGLTALMTASHYGHERVVDYLLQHGADANLQNSTGLTALMLAAKRGHERVVGLLIWHGAEINKQDSIDQTALVYAARYGQRADGRAAASARR